MGDPTLPRLFLELALLLLGGLCIAGEAALKELAGDPLIRDESDPLARLARSPAHPLAACRIVLTAESFAAAVTCVNWFAFPFAWAKAYPTLNAALVLTVLGFIHLILVSYLPRRLAIHMPEKVGRSLLGFLSLISLLLRPLSWLVNSLTGLLLRLFGVDPRTETEAVSEEDIRLMVDMGEEKGAIEKEEKELIENVFEFNNSTAGDVMVHRTDVEMIWVEDTDAEIMEAIRSSGLTRFPVYEEDQDDIIGILNTRDYLLNTRLEQPHPLRELLRKAYFVPETVRTDVLFRDMQNQKIHLAVVVDEYGGTSGIITMEDLLEELVGNIYDEFDPQDEQEIVSLGENLWRIAGSADLEDVSDALGVTFPDNEEAETLGGLVFARLDVIPADGSRPTVEADGLRIEVEELTDRRVEWARVSKLASAPPVQEQP
ncbi:MAG: hemolysin family protein [Pseudoflavonifractor sp.]|nr:hemolysin family protein [Pseudoflavonifractor sp.]